MMSLDLDHPQRNCWRKPGEPRTHCAMQGPNRHTHTHKRNCNAQRRSISPESPEEIVSSLRLCQEAEGEAVLCGRRKGCTVPHARSAPGGSR